MRLSMADETAPTTGRLRGLGLGDILTVREAATALAMRYVDAVKWLRDEGLIRAVAGKDRVVWLDVVETARRSGITHRPKIEPAPRAEPPPPPPRKLNRMKIS